jgi:hypothetical protein
MVLFRISFPIFKYFAETKIVPSNEDWIAYHRFSHGIMVDKLSASDTYYPARYSHYSKFRNDLVTSTKEARICSYVKIELSIDFQIIDISKLDEHSIEGTENIQKWLNIFCSNSLTSYINDCTKKSYVCIGTSCHNDVAPNDIIKALRKYKAKFTEDFLNEINYKGVEVISLDYKIVSKAEDFTDMLISPEKKWTKATTI